jgi:predicted RecB family endonuclease
VPHVDDANDPLVVARAASPSAQRLAEALGSLVAATLREDHAVITELLAAIGQRRVELE